MNPPYFDAASGQWIVSRYADVMAALQDPRLAQTGGPSHASLRDDTQAALSPARLAALRSQAESAATRILAALSARQPIDLVGQFARPWCAELACTATGGDLRDLPRLAALASQVTAAAADPADRALKSVAAEANRELEATLPAGGIPMAGAAFVALSETLPALLSRIWLALLRHGEQLALLRADSTLLPAAIEELLRYAGLARQLTRVATESLTLGGGDIAEGQRVVLMLRLANRDPLQFPDPDRLDVTRRAAGHLALGSGRNSCVGAALIRMAASVATGAFVSTFSDAALSAPVEWRGGDSGFRVPVALYVLRPPGLGAGHQGIGYEESPDGKGASR